MVDLNLTKRQQEIFDFIKRYSSRHGYPPTVRDIGKAVGLASSSNRPIIDLVLEIAGLAGSFRATVSSEEVPHGKPSPDVYLEVARRLEADPSACIAVEDSTNGIRSAQAAGMRVIAVPRPDYPPSAEALELAAVRLDSLAELTPRVVERAATTA